ncbi:MAG: hypothetical protein HC897_05475 [Thermoanaerobaculia bacterium]|nr:hypothetical protein [Thermoanaerobaculia bacterium]
MVQLEYDVQDHLSKVTDGEGGVTTFETSDRDLQTREVSEVSGETAFTYNEHGILEEKTDARGVTVLYTNDALDRTTFDDYPGSELDVTRVYDDPLVPFSKGRMTSVDRNGHPIPMRYDRFGRMTRDGALEYVLDANGNRAEIEYPGGVRAIYSHDYADREATLELAVPGEPVQPVVESASYLPFGPLAEITLGNGLTETHTFDERYYPQRITVAGGAPLLDWQYTVDDVGNPTAIADLAQPEPKPQLRYQDYQYYLTSGVGPWGYLSCRSAAEPLENVARPAPADPEPKRSHPAVHRRWRGFSFPRCRGARLRSRDLWRRFRGRRALGGVAQDRNGLRRGIWIRTVARAGALFRRSRPLRRHGRGR